MSLDYYNAQQKEWVSPKLVLIYHDKLLSKYGNLVYTNGLFKKVIEAKAVAISLIGINKVTKEHFMMQVPKDINSSPDIVTMNLREYADKPVQMEIQDIEVVEYREISSETILDFLVKTKLSSGKYDEKSIILCYITKKNTLIDHQKLHEGILAINPKAMVCLLGEIPSSNKCFRYVRVYPKPDSYVEFNIKDAEKYPSPDACSFTLGSNKKVVYGKGNKPLPNETSVFELDINKINKFANIRK